MCLQSIDRKPRRKFGTGYKLLKRREDGTYTCYDHLPHSGSVIYPLNKWITDPNDGDAIEGSQGRLAGYRTGFHITLDRKVLSNIKATLPIVIVKVRFRKVVATSCDELDSIYGRQVVAREIMNLGEV